jgi:uncharacterized ion transporter superfamily protein YfcC
MTESAEKTAVHTSPVVILLGIVLLATALTYLVDSGRYERIDGAVVPGSYAAIDKERSIGNLLRTTPMNSEDGVASPASLVDTFLSVPKGMQRLSGLIFMVLIIGGMFGILEESGTITAAIDRLLASVRGNIYLLVPLLMTIFAMGSTFLGLASEYLMVIPLIVAMTNRIGLSNIVGLAIVTVAVKVGYLASVTNPVPLSVAQPLVGLPVFSGAGLRFAFFLVFLIVGIGFVLLMIRREGYESGGIESQHMAKLDRRHAIVLVALLAGVAGLVISSSRWQWHHIELSAYYIFLSVVLATLAGLDPTRAANAFVNGMKKILMASMLIGVAAAVAVILESGQILDTIVYGLTSMIGDAHPAIAANGIFASQLMLDFLIPSTSGQAAVSMPIIGPIGQVTGVSSQTTVLAFLFGNGITNMLTPTSGTLLAYLASANVAWPQWARFILPLWATFIFLSVGMLIVAVLVGF